MIKFLSSFIGFDEFFLDKNSNNIINIVFFFFLYLLLISLSIYSFFNVGLMLSENFYVAVFSALFLTYILHNMYMLILATSYDGNNLSSSKQILSYISIKGFLIIILSFLISASLATKLFESDVKLGLNSFKKEFIIKYSNLLDISFNKQINDLKSEFKDKQKLADLLNLSVSPNGIESILNNYPGFKKNRAINNDSIKLIKDLKHIENIKKSKINALIITTNKSNFFIQKIRIVSSTFKFWILTFFIIVLFLFPLYLFNTTTFFLNYQLNIINNNNKLVLDEYNDFKSNYSNIYLKSIGERLNVIEMHVDPPFNNNKIIREEMILKKGSLLTWLNKYNA